MESCDNRRLIGPAITRLLASCGSCILKLFTTSKFKIRNIGTEIATTNPLVSLAVEIFSNILEYLDWGDVGRFDTAFLNRGTRNCYLFALQLRKVKVERNRFWENAVDRGVLSWLMRRNIRVISLDLWVNNAQLISIANGFPQLQLQSLDISACDYITDEVIRAVSTVCPQLRSLNISHCRNITDEGIRALARGLRQLQSLNIIYCCNITDEGITALARGLHQLQSLEIGFCEDITDEGIRAVARGLPQLQSLYIGFCVNITDEGWVKKEKIILNKYRTI